MNPHILMRSVVLAVFWLGMAAVAHADAPPPPSLLAEASESTDAVPTEGRDQHSDVYTVAHDPWPQLLALVDDKLAAHPILQTHRSEAYIAERMVDGVGIRPDATLSLAAVAIPWKPPALNADPMSAIELGVSVPLWYPKELKAQKSAAQAQAFALESVVETARTELLIEATELYYEIYAIDRAIVALEHIKPLLEQHIELLKRRIPTGHASLVQVERVRLNLMRVDDQIHTQKDARPAKVARLNVVLNRPADADLPPMVGEAQQGRTQSTNVDISPDTPLAQLDPLVEHGMAHRPLLESLERQKQSARAEADAANWARRPQLAVFGGWMFRAKQKNPAMMDDGMDMFSLGFQSTLPIASRHRANAARDVAEARTVALDSAARAFEQQLRGEISARLLELHRVVEHAQFYKNELIPQANRVRTAAMAGLDANRADYEAWIDAEQQLAEIEVSFAQLEATILKHHAMISMLTGESLRAERTPHDEEHTP